MKELVSVVIPIKNPDEDVFKKCLDSVLSQNYDNTEIIIVDASRNRSGLIDEYMNIHNNIIYIKQKRKNLGGGRQDAMDVAHGIFTVELDSDCIAEKNWIFEMTKSLDESKNEVFVAGKSLSHSTGTVESNIQREYDEWINHVTFLMDNKRYSLTIDGKNFGYITKFGKFLKFDEDLAASEDFDFATRARRKGFKIIFSDSAIVYHVHRQNTKDLIHQKIWHGTGYGQNMVKNDIDFEMHFQMKNLLILFIGTIFFPLTIPIFLCYLLKLKKRERIYFLFKNIFYWSFIWGTLKGMYREGGLKFLLLKTWSDIFKNIHYSQIYNLQ